MNIKKHSLKDLSRNEMIKINGGESWLFRLGKAAHEAYDKVVDYLEEASIPASESALLGPNSRPTG